MAPTHACKTPLISTGSRSNQKRNRVRGATITPIIKIVHVNAPMLVRTDVANFRALVQEMTGKDTARHHNIKDINYTDCSTTTTTEASTNETRNKEKLEAKTEVSSQAPTRAHRSEAAYCNSTRGARCLLQGGMEEKGTYGIISKNSYSNEAEEEVSCERQMESPSCDRSVDSFFAESTEEDPYKNMRAFFATSTTYWRQPLDIPGGFELFDVYC